MHQAVPDHLILPLETLATVTSGTTFDWAKVRPSGAVNVAMRAARKSVLAFDNCQLGNAKLVR